MSDSSQLDASVDALARLLHESGRAAVEQGKVYMKGPDITPRPFAEWDDLPEDARIGRCMMAIYLIEHAPEVVGLIEHTIPAYVKFQREVGPSETSRPSDQ